VTRSNVDMTMYLVVRRDLNLSAAGIATHVGHAVHRVIRATEQAARFAAARDRLDCHDAMYLLAWEGSGATKVILCAENADDLVRLQTSLDAARVVSALVESDGDPFTEPGTITALGIQPMPHKVIYDLVSRLKWL